MKAPVEGAGPIRFDPDRGEHQGSWYPGAPVWEPGEGLDAFFPDADPDGDGD